MAVSQVVTYSLLAMITLSLLVIFMTSYIRGQQVLTGAEEYKQELQLDQLQTKIYIKSVSISQNFIYVIVTNNGSTNLYKFNKFSVIVKYYANISNVSTLLVSEYNYSKSLGPYLWTTNSVLINPDNDATFIIDLPYPPYPNTLATIVIATNYGPEAIWRGTL